MRLLPALVVAIAAIATAPFASADSLTPPDVRLVRTASGFTVAMDDDLKPLDSRARPNGGLERVDPAGARLVGDHVPGAERGVWFVSTYAGGKGTLYASATKSVTLETTGSVRRIAALGGDWFAVIAPTRASMERPENDPLDLHLFGADFVEKPLPISNVGLIDIVDTGKRRIAFRHQYEKMNEYGGRTFVRAEIYEPTWKLVATEELPGSFAGAASGSSGAFALISTSDNRSEVLRYDANGTRLSTRAPLVDGITGVQAMGDSLVAYGEAKMFQIDPDLTVTPLPTLDGVASIHCNAGGCAGLRHASDGYYAAYVAAKATKAEAGVKVFDAVLEADPETYDGCSTSAKRGSSPVGAGGVVLSIVAAMLVSRRRARIRVTRRSLAAGIFSRAVEDRR